MMKTKILIFENEKIIGEALKLILLDEGYLVHVENTVEQINEIIDNFKPSIIITARKFPKLTAIDIIKIIRQNVFSKNVPIIYITGSGEQRKEALDAGANISIFKPIDINKFLFSIKSFANLN